MFHRLVAPPRFTWSSPSLWTNIRPATRRRGAPPAPPARTLFSLTTPERRSPAYPNSLPTPTGQPLRNVDTSHSLTDTDSSSAPCLMGLDFAFHPAYIPRDEAKNIKSNNNVTLNPLRERSSETVLDQWDCRLQLVMSNGDFSQKTNGLNFSLHFGHSTVRSGEWDGLIKSWVFFCFLFFFLLKVIILLFGPNPEKWQHPSFTLFL